jgi:curved DNA-binding protein CbpA
VSEERNPYDILQVSPNALPQVVEAAYRALALLQHPDRTGDPEDDHVMADLNWAFSVLRDPEQRIAYDQGRMVEMQVAADPEPEPEPEAPSPTLMERVQEAAQAAVERDAENPANVTLDFGRYAGRTLGHIMRVEPAYLEWLRRHSSGIRYRHQIDALVTALAARRAAAAERAASAE